MIDPLKHTALRWRCDPALVPADSTRDIEPRPGVIGQESALQALEFGIRFNGPHHHIFVRGLHGTGRLQMVKGLLEDLAPRIPSLHDLCYVHNFAAPEAPRLIRLPAGGGRHFRRYVREFSDFIENRLNEAMQAEPIRAQQQALGDRLQRDANQITEALSEELKKNGLVLVSMQTGTVTQTAIYPLVDGAPVSPEQLDQMVEQGKVTAEDYDALLEKRKQFREPLRHVTEEVGRLYRSGQQQAGEFLAGVIRDLLNEAARSIRERFEGDAVATFIDEIIDDVIEAGVDARGEGRPIRPSLYRVNVLIEREVGHCPIVIERQPSLVNLLGSTDPEWSPQGPVASDFSRIRAGSLLRADGGFLVLDANDLLTEPGAWRVLVRTLTSRRLEICPPERTGLYPRMMLKPEPIAIDVRVVLIGSAGLYQLLDERDPDFCDLFKVLADFDDMVLRDERGVAQYAGVLARIVMEERLLDFDRSGIAALAEYGARVAARRDRMTARFSRVADTAREATFLAREEAKSEVSATHVYEAMRRRKERASLPSRHFQAYLADGTIKIYTHGRVVGQINGLAVISAGPLVYGFPARVTATIGAGHEGLVDIESSASMSGSIHTKGFQILGGMLRHLLNTDHPLAFSASVTFEQSYGGIDGDSASGAEACCLLSALTGIPIKQNIAMTGAVDQLGHVQAVGGVNEKIEGFFDACSNRELSGDQGVIIPQSNAGDLMLRRDVVEACEAGRFFVYAVGDIREALEILTDATAGVPNEDGRYEDGTLLAKAVKRAEEYWLKTLQPPRP